MLVQPVLEHSLNLNNRLGYGLGVPVHGGCGGNWYAIVFLLLFNGGNALTHVLTPLINIQGGLPFGVGNF